MTATELLAQAQQVLTTRTGLSARMAAFLSRQALEEIIDQRCAALGAAAASATVRSKLLILRALDDPADADRAAVAWNRLSNASHVHAYEMQPSVAEIAHLRAMVVELLPKTRSQTA
jgi:hypothetical protein